MKANPKLRGEWVESLFLARAHENGLFISKPWGDSARYDFVIEGGSRNHHGAPQLRRVQVKSTSRRLRRGYLCHLDSCNRSVVTAYTAAQIDFFAIYIIPERIWYILPIHLLSGCRGNLYLNPRAPGKFNRYIEAWSLLGSPLVVPQIYACADAEPPAGPVF